MIVSGIYVQIDQNKVLESLSFNEYNLSFKVRKR